MQVQMCEAEPRTHLREQAALCHKIKNKNNKCNAAGLLLELAFDGDVIFDGLGTGGEANAATPEV